MDLVTPSMSLFDPPQFHVRRRLGLYLLFWLLLLVLILVIYSAVRMTVEQQAQAGLLERMRTQTQILQEHATKTLGIVQSRMQGLVVNSVKAGGATTLSVSSRSLQGILRDTPALNSLTVVDSRRNVIASSDAERHGQRLRAEVALAEANVPVLPVRIDGKVTEQDPFLPGTGVSALWLIGPKIELNGEAYYWLMAVDKEIFRRMWSVMTQHANTWVGIFGAGGDPWITSAQFDQVRTGIERMLSAKDRVRASSSTTLEHLPTRQGDWLAYYRYDDQSQWAVAVALDEQVLHERLEQVNKLLNGMALTAALFVTLLAAGTYWLHLRFEAALTNATGQSLALSVHLMVSETDASGRITSANEALLQRTGYTEAELLGQHNRIFGTNTNSADFYEELWQTVSGGHVWKGSFRNKTKSGENYWVNATIVPFKNAKGTVDRYVTMYSDISEAVILANRLENERLQRVELEAFNRQLQASVNNDPLTGVFNRRGFDQFCAKAWASCEKMGQPFSLLMLDLDYFKSVNDQNGHAAGDEVLKTLCNRWQQQIRASDMLARIGGEEFCIVLLNASRPETQMVAQKLCKVTAEPIRCHSVGQTLQVTVSIGMASTGPHPPYKNAEDLMAEADKAMYRAKHLGRNQVVSL